MPWLFVVGPAAGGHVSWSRKVEPCFEVQRARPELQVTSGSTRRSTCLSPPDPMWQGNTVPWMDLLKGQTSCLAWQVVYT